MTDHIPTKVAKAMADRNKKPEDWKKEHDWTMFWWLITILTLVSVFAFRLGVYDGIQNAKRDARKVSDRFYRYCQTGAPIKTTHGVYICYKVEDY